MRKFDCSSTGLMALFLISIPAVTSAQTTHVVQVDDNAFHPALITIQPGDTVRWENPPGGASHNVLADDFTWSSGAIASSFTYERTFNTVGMYPYHCEPHRNFGMVGQVNVQGIVDPGSEINPGHSGNWWNGLARNGEGAQIEVSDGGDGELVFVVTFYSYGPAGGQIFLIGVGTPDGDTVEVEVFITDGPVWGDDFDPTHVMESAWGTGTFTAKSCDEISMVLTPNVVYGPLGAEYSTLEYDLVRLTTPAIACPYEG